MLNFKLKTILCFILSLCLSVTYLHAQTSSQLQGTWKIVSIETTGIFYDYAADTMLLVQQKDLVTGVKLTDDVRNLRTRFRAFAKTNITLDAEGFFKVFGTSFGTEDGSYRVNETDKTITFKKLVGDNLLDNAYAYHVAGSILKFTSLPNAPQQFTYTFVSTP